MLSGVGIAGGTRCHDTEGRSVLRMASVKAWDGNKDKHLAATNKLQTAFEKQGARIISSKSSNIATEVIERKDYTRVANGRILHAKAVSDLGSPRTVDQGRRIGEGADGVRRLPAAAPAADAGSGRGSGVRAQEALVAAGGAGSGNFGHSGGVGGPGNPGGSTGGGWKSAGGWEHTGVTWKQETDPKTGRAIPIKVDTVEEAMALVLDGKVVEVKGVRRGL